MPVSGSRTRSLRAHFLAAIPHTTGDGPFELEIVAGAEAVHVGDADVEFVLRHLIVGRVDAGIECPEAGGAADLIAGAAIPQPGQ